MCDRPMAWPSGRPHVPTKQTSVPTDRLHNQLAYGPQGRPVGRPANQPLAWPTACSTGRVAVWPCGTSTLSVSGRLYSMPFSNCNVGDLFRVPIVLPKNFLKALTEFGAPWV